MHRTALLAITVLTISAAGLSRAAAGADAPPPLPQAHAHNDYLHPRPLADALDHGFSSVEADIFLVDGKLLVAHAAREIKPGRTLQALYLDPLRARVNANGGSVHPGGAPFHLLIDLKSPGEPTYAALSKLLAEYADILSVVRDGKSQSKAVTVSISGDRPFATIVNQPIRYAGVDGRMRDLDSDLPAHAMPLVSDNWTLHFKWRGVGRMPEAERQKLKDAVDKAHAHGRRIRFWATPDVQQVWRELHAAGVDLINTDDLDGLEKFLRDQPTKN